MKNLIQKLLLVVALFVLPASAFAQAWTRDQGHFYTNLSYTRISGAGHYDFNGVKRLFPEPSKYVQNTLGLYGEFGLVDRWLTATLSSELLRNNILTEQGETMGFGDMNVGLWSGVITKPFRLSLGVNVGLPTGDPLPEDRGDGANDNSSSVANSLPTGDGELDFTPGVAFGYSFGGANSTWPLVHYLVIKGGYQIRTKENLKPSVSYKVELGSKLPGGMLERFWLITRFFGLEGLSLSEDSTGSIGGTGNFTHTTLGLELFSRLGSGFGVSASTDLAVRAKGIVAGIPLKVALSYEY